MRFTNRRLTQVLVLGVVGVLALALAVPALAQDSDEPSDDPKIETETFEQRKDERQAAFAEALADELDLPVERVAEAVDTVREQFAEQRRERLHGALEERLDEAVADGALTREQADAILEAAEEGVFRPGRRWLHHHRAGLGDGPGRSWFGAPDSDVTPDAAPDGTPAPDADATSA